MKQHLPDGVGVEQSPAYQAFVMEAVAFVELLADGIDRTPLTRRSASDLPPAAAFWRASRTTKESPFDRRRRCEQVLRCRIWIASRNTSPPSRRRWQASSTARMSFRRNARWQRCSRRLVRHESRPPLVRDRGWRHSPRADGPIVSDRIEGRRHASGLRPRAARLFVARRTRPRRRAVDLADGRRSADIRRCRHLSLPFANAIRNRFRETRAHNTVVVGGRSQSDPAGPFMWARKTAARHGREPSRGRAGLSPGSMTATAKTFGVDHRRQLARSEDGFAIADRLTGARRPLPVDIQFLCHPGLSVATRRRHRDSRGPSGRLAEIVPPQGFRISHLKGETDYSRGWVSSGFGQIEPAPMIVLSGTMSDTECVTQVRINRFETGRRLEPAGGRDHDKPRQSDRMPATFHRRSLCRRGSSCS